MTEKADLLKELRARTVSVRRFRWAEFAGVTALAVASFWLWVHALGSQSLGFDEGLSVVFASRPLPKLIHTLIYEDLHPPLHYLVLHFWMLLAGRSEIAVRMPSAMAAILLVPLAYAVASEVWGQQAHNRALRAATGIGAAALVASSPFLGYYAQETRMYSLAVMWTLASTWAYLKAIQQPGRRWWFFFSALLAASLYTLYTSAFLIPAYWVYALLLDRRSWPRTLRYTLLAGLLCVPWLPAAYLQVARLLRTPDYWVNTRIDVLAFLRAMWNAFLPNTRMLWGVLTAALVTVGLAILALRKKLRLTDPVRRAALVFLCALVPLALTYPAVRLAPKFVPRYAIAAAAPSYIVAAWALYALLGRRRVGRAVWAATILAAVALSLRSALAVADGRESPRDDARSVAAHLTQNARPGDAILLVENAPYSLQYYYQGPVPMYGLHVGVDFAQEIYILNTMLRAAPKRVWLVQWHHEFADPTDVVVTDLLRVGQEIEVAQQFRGYRLRAFDIRGAAAAPTLNPPPSTALDARFRAGLGLLGFDRLDGGSGRLHYVLHWQAMQPLTRNYGLTIGLQDAAGNEYLRKDQALCTDYFLPPVWPLRTTLRCRVDLLLPADLPALTYRVYLKVLDPVSLDNLDLLDAQGAPQGQVLFLEDLPISKSELSSLPVQPEHPMQADMGDGLQLLGFDLQETRYHQGDNVSVTLWWLRAFASPPGDPAEVVRFRLLDSKGSVAWEGQEPILPTRADWPPGEVNRAVYRLAIPSDLSGGDYHLQAGLRGGAISLVRIQVAAREHRFEVPQMQHAVGLNFEHGITLLGYDLSSSVVQPGGVLTVMLYWQAQAPVSGSYKVSVQVVSEDMRLVAQEDSIPVRWTYPTSAWLAGEIIADEHTLVIQNDAAPGDQSLIVALYEEATSVRLRVEQEGDLRDHAVLGTLHIAP